MDLGSLTLVLRAALSHAPEERKAAEANLTQVSAPYRRLDHALLSLGPLLVLTRYGEAIRCLVLPWNPAQSNLQLLSSLSS